MAEVEIDHYKLLYVDYDYVKKRFPQEMAYYWMKSLSISLDKVIKIHKNLKNFAIRPRGRYHGDHLSYYGGALPLPPPALPWTKGY